LHSSHHGAIHAGTNFSRLRSLLAILPPRGTYCSFKNQPEEIIKSSGWWLQPSEKYEFVSWDDDYSQYMESQKIRVPNHQFVAHQPVIDLQGRLVIGDASFPIK